MEVLTPDFLDRDHALDRVLAAAPDIFNHNLETVRRLTPSVRHRATYDRSLAVLRKAKERGGPAMLTKSGMMLGLGEAHEEVMQALEDLRAARVDLLTLGQYLQPTPQHWKVHRWVHPDEFSHWKSFGLSLGIGVVESGAMVRSSYHADEQSERFTGAEHLNTANSLADA